MVILAKARGFFFVVKSVVEHLLFQGSFYTFQFGRPELGANPTGVHSMLPLIQRSWMGYVRWLSWLNPGDLINGPPSEVHL